MSRRDQIRMTDEEVAVYLAEQHTLQVASNDHDGFPHLVPMWYALLDGKLAFWTYARSQKAVNLRRDDRITCLVESGDDYANLRGVQVKGHARLIEDAAAVRAFGESLMARYTGGVLTDAGRDMVAAQAAKRLVVGVEPVEIVSWDHRKLGGIY